MARTPLIPQNRYFPIALPVCLNATYEAKWAGVWQLQNERCFAADRAMGLTSADSGKGEVFGRLRVAAFSAKSRRANAVLADQETAGVAFIYEIGSGQD
jgi:hypothetical protein